MSSDDEYYDNEHDQLDFYCSICGAFIEAIGDPSECFIDDLVCDVCEKNIDEYISALPDPLSPRLPPKIKSVDL